MSTKGITNRCTGPVQRCALSPAGELNRYTFYEDVSKIHNKKTDLPNSLVGVLDRKNQGKENWIDDNYLGFLLKNSKLSYGRWHKEKDKWRFTFDQKENLTTNFEVGEVIDAIDGYWGERVELVISDKFRWEPATFKAKENWDHDHCEICWATISEMENTNHYCSEGQHPVCIKCYDEHISIKDVSFVPENV